MTVGSERYVVVQVAVERARSAAARGGGRAAAAPAAAGTAHVPAAIAGIVIAPATTATAAPATFARLVEQGQRAVEVLEHDFGRVALLPAIILPLPRLE